MVRQAHHERIPVVQHEPEIIMTEAGTDSLQAAVSTTETGFGRCLGMMATGLELTPSLVRL